MKKIASAVLSVFFTLAGNTQETSKDRTTTETGKPDDRQKTPKYPGGLKEFHNLIDPKIQRLISYKPGSMVVTFMVNEDGNISDVETVQGISRKFDEKVREIIAKSPKWIPGELDGEIVKIQHRLSLHFS